MLKWVLWASAGCLGILAALALSRGMEFGHPAEERAPAEVAPAVEKAAKPAAAAVPVTPPVEAAVPPPPPPPTDEQVADDAAAVGMTTREPAEDPPAEAPTN